MCRRVGGSDQKSRIDEYIGNRATKQDEGVENIIVKRHMRGAKKPEGRLYRWNQPET